MRKTISLLLTISLMAICFSFSSMTALAITGTDTAPAINEDEALAISVPSVGLDEENAVCVAKFTPAEDGFYEFTTDVVFSTGSSVENEPASGIISINETEEVTTSFNIFFDRNGLSAEDIAELEETGIDLTNIDKVACVAELKKDVEYLILFSQDGENDYEANLTVSKHVHDLQDEERHNYEYGADGIYTVCKSWPCTYEELKEAFNVEYKIIEGENQNIKRGEDLVIKCDGMIEKFQDLYIDDEVVSDADYETEEGSTIVTVHADYLDKLALGKHTVKMTYVDGEASTEFNIENEKPVDSKNSTTSPKTGAGVMSAFGAIALLATAALGVTFKKEKE